MMFAMAVFGIVVLAVFILGSLISALMLLPDFLRYMKMRSLLPSARSLFLAGTSA